MESSPLFKEIAELKARRKAVILAHNYCRGEVQDIADFTGDSLELARKATEIEADVIVFCGVYFMAETAKILNPLKRVLIPDPSAGCPMADMINAAQLRELKAKYPEAKAVCYVNSTAEVKAECDICVTSGNAEAVMKTLKGEQIIFVPDQHLGSHVGKLLGENYIRWPGYCPIHARLGLEDIAEGRRIAGMDAPVLVHPECDKPVREAADMCLSTGAMCRYVRESEADTFVIGTEEGILHRLQKENPDKEFVAIGELKCHDMKKITLEKVRDSLRDYRHEVIVDKEISIKAKKAIERMLQVNIMKEATTTAAAIAASCAIAAQDFGKLSDGTETKLYTLEGKGGLRVDVTDYGAKIVRVFAPDRDGKLADVALGWNTAAEYEKGGFSMGTQIGRFGNRIADGTFKLDGKEYVLNINEKTATRNCNLHGGPKGWDSKLWKAEPFKDGDIAGIKLSLVSPDGDMGFPGKVEVSVVYRVLPDNVLTIDYVATTDAPTVINLTHHGYWNMAGEASGDVLKQLLQIEADEYLATTPGLIPTKAVSVEGTGFDFRKLRPIDERADWMANNAELKYTDNWYDHCFVIRGKNGELRRHAIMMDPVSGRKLEVWSSEPGMQMYGAQNMNGTLNAKEPGKKLVKCAGMALETQHYPDSPNHPEFPSTVLRPGETFSSRTEYRFSAE